MARGTRRGQVRKRRLKGGRIVWDAVAFVGKDEQAAGQVARLILNAGDSGAVREQTVSIRPSGAGGSKPAGS